MIENKILLWNNFETTYSIVKKQGAKPIIPFVSPPPPPAPDNNKKKKKTQTKWHVLLSYEWTNELKPKSYYL